MSAETVVAFVSAARAFCAWADGEPGAEPIVSVVLKALTLVSNAYALSFALPDKLPGVETIAKVRYPTAARPRWSAMPFDTYRDVAVPHLPESMMRVEARSLVADLNAIYANLSAGLEHYDSGRVEDAVSLWVFTAEHAWGDHAVSAMRALQLFVD